MQHFRNLRFALIQGSLSLLVLTSCYLGFASNHYRHRLCAHAKQAVELTLVTLLAQKTLQEDQQVEYEDAIQENALQAAAIYHTNRSDYDIHWAHVLHNTSLALQAQATYLSTAVLPELQEAFAEERPSSLSVEPTSQQAVQRHWCQATLLQAFCHFVSGTTSLADPSATGIQQQQQHWAMLQHQQSATETWILRVVSNQTTLYTESARAVQDFVTVLQQQAADEQALADWDWQQVYALQYERQVLHNQTLQLRHDIETNTATRNVVWQQAKRDGWLAYTMGLVSVCCAIVGVVALVVALVGVVATTSTAVAAWPLAVTTPGRYAILRRCIIAWCVVGFVNQLTTMDGGSRLYKAMISDDVTEKVEWVVGLAVMIGVGQSLLLHDFCHSSLSSWVCHGRNLLLDSAKFSAVSILHLLTVWLVGAGLVPGTVATLLLNTTTQLVLVGIYVIVMVWEPPVVPTGEATTVLTEESDESTPLQSATNQHPKYLEEDSSSAVIYLGGLSSSGGGASSSSDCYTTAADTGGVTSWNVLLLVCLVRTIGMVAPSLQLLHPFISGCIVGGCAVASIAVALQWSQVRLEEHDDRLPRTIVV